MKTLELLAPAKNLEIGTAAIDCGADAVYIAGPKFGAREKAGNSFEDIAALCSYAHRFGAKVYITINTLLKESEFAQVQQYLDKAYKGGCDGVIVQDLRLLNLKLPPLKIIASTQCNIRTVERAKELESLGFKRLILARELSLEQIREIREAVKCELEFFVHGALCVCYSGCCYLSEYLTGRSANRGECAQPCRNNYDLVTESGKTLVRNKALLSLKDFNLSLRISDLVLSGISSFKIEGRLKNISYVKNIVTLYNRALNEFIALHQKAFCRSSLGESFAKFDARALSTFNRGYTEYFLNGHTRSKHGEKIGSGIAKYIGEPVAKVASALLTSSKHSEIKIVYNPLKGKTPLNNGDGVCFVIKDGSVVGARVNSAENKEAVLQLTDYKGNVKELSGLVIYRNLDFAFEKVLAQKVKRLIPIGLEVEFSEGAMTVCSKKPLLKLSFKEENFPSQSKDKCLEIFKAQLSKEAGDFIFSIASVKGDPPFYKAATLNKIRRELARRLSEKVEKERVAEACSINTEAVKALSIKEKGWRPFEGYNGELMRTKYCLRYELGMCLKDRIAQEKREKLFLKNNGRLLELKFDCKKCEMVVAAVDKKL